MLQSRMKNDVVFVYFSTVLVWQAAYADDTINLSELASGKLTFRQMDGNETYLRSSLELAAEIPTEASFELLDPRHMFRYVKFTYTWDLGNGEVVVGKEPFVRYNYNSSGNYTVKLTLGAYWARHTRLKGFYCTDLTVLDAIRTIELMGPLDYKVAQSTSLSVFVGGSPPMWICWSMVPNCVAVSPVSCHWVKLYGNTFNLNYTFTSSGKYCLNMTVRNDISALQTSYDIIAWRDPTSNLLFIFPCAGLVLSTFALIIATLCRSKRSAQRNRVEAPRMETKYKSVGTSPGFDLISSSQMNSEDQPLLPQCRESSSISTFHRCNLFT
ncbi:hypothetical protein GJAV_G00262350 [Gymnothorax javanicus]|nr:hypothetical protein GJAV_G00262350 [Gymnothorax javanicus]